MKLLKTKKFQILISTHLSKKFATLLILTKLALFNSCNTFDWTLPPSQWRMHKGGQGWPWSPQFFQFFFILLVLWYYMLF